MKSYISNISSLSLRTSILAVLTFLFIFLSAIFLFKNYKNSSDLQIKRASSEKAITNISPASVSTTGIPTQLPQFTVHSQQEISSTPSPVVFSSSPTQIPTDSLRLTEFNPPFLWADYQSIGPTEANIYGSGFTPTTSVILFGPYDSPDMLMSSQDSQYPLHMEHFYSSQYMLMRLPDGLYNSYYSVQITNPDGTRLLMNNVLVVSGSTKEMSDSISNAHASDSIDNPEPTSSESATQ